MARVMTPTTSLGEKARVSGVEANLTSPAHSSPDWISGVIRKVDKVRRCVQIADPATGKSLFGEKVWVTLAHTVRDINDRFGQVRTGMQVLVFYKGTRGSPAEAWAFIIGDEGEYGPNKELVENDAKMGFHYALMEKT